MKRAKQRSPRVRLLTTEQFMCALFRQAWAGRPRSLIVYYKGAPVIFMRGD